jgi:hypothetical protein
MAPIRFLRGISMQLSRSESAPPGLSTVVDHIVPAQQGTIGEQEPMPRPGALSGMERQPALARQTTLEMPMEGLTLVSPGKGHEDSVAHSQRRVKLQLGEMKQVMGDLEWIALDRWDVILFICHI